MVDSHDIWQKGSLVAVRVEWPRMQKRLEESEVGANKEETGDLSISKALYPTSAVKPIQSWVTKARRAVQVSHFPNEEEFIAWYCPDTRRSAIEAELVEIRAGFDAAVEDFIVHEPEYRQTMISLFRNIVRNEDYSQEVRFRMGVRWFRVDPNGADSQAVIEHERMIREFTDRQQSLLHETVLTASRAAIERLENGKPPSEGMFNRLKKMIAYTRSMNFMDDAALSNALAGLEQHMENAGHAQQVAKDIPWQDTFKRALTLTAEVARPIDTPLVSGTYSGRQIEVS